MHTGLITDWASRNGISITDAQLNLLAKHQEKVLETNKYMNLTAITCPQEFAVKHIIDSMALLPYIPCGIKLADIGTGAGFPGIVLAIMRPDLRVTLIDSLRKRIFFLQEIIHELGLENVQAVHSRAEDNRLGMAFDICTARAVAPMDKLARWVLPITAPGGTFLAMKGPDVTQELENAKPAVAKQGGLVEAVDMVEIAPGMMRSIVVISRK